MVSIPVGDAVLSSGVLGVTFIIVDIKKLHDISSSLLCNVIVISVFKSVLHSDFFVTVRTKHCGKNPLSSIAFNHLTSV